SLIGRGTSGYVTFDTTLRQVVWIKDYWRVNLPSILPEGETYRRLMNAKVPHIPKIGPSGDVKDIRLTEPNLPISSGELQRTRTSEYVSHPWCAGHPVLAPRIHYRVVLETVGRSLSKFESTRELCRAVKDAIEAHSVAYSGAHILHRDISSNNILIGENGEGLLIDWGLSKGVEPEEEEPQGARQHARTVSQIPDLSRRFTTASN
ncbi:hypothetical protein BC834DRAFT_829028, partial [Gloeopeniophorella convolvens]